jgi:hypothetical protein
MFSARIHLFALALAFVAPAVLAPATSHADPPAEVGKGKKNEKADKKNEKEEKSAATASVGWKKLGERDVNGKVDKDVISVGADDGVFTAIQIKVEASSLVMHEIKVVFANGETFEPKTKLTFDKDTSTRNIDLPGDKRVIKRVEFKYGNLPGGGKARVELWGKAAPAPFQKLGERDVNGKLDKDVIDVGADDGVFTAIQVKVEGSSLVMQDIKIIFGNGETFDAKTKLVFDKDTTTRMIDLPGNKRVIKRVEFKYGNLAGGGKARVELWGKR